MWNLEAGEIVISAARSLQPINLRGVCAVYLLAYRMIWSGAFTLLSVASFTDTNIPIWEYDSSPIRTGSIFHSRLPIRKVCSSTWVLLPFRQRVGINWNLIGTDLPKSQSHRESHCAMTLSVRLWAHVQRIHHINFIFCTIHNASYVDSVDVNFRCRKSIKPKASKKNLERSKSDQWLLWRVMTMMKFLPKELPPLIISFTFKQKKAIDFSLYSGPSLPYITHNRFIPLNIIKYQICIWLINHILTNTITIGQNGES